MLDIELLSKISRQPFWFLALLILALVLRLLHLGPDLDEPHVWRQADTAFYIHDFHHKGIDLMHPSVSWMGPHKTVIFEFPLPEAMAALVHRVFGESLLWSRLFFLLVYGLGAWFLYRVFLEVMEADLARMSILVYLFLPLGIFYSRAIHVDFFALMLSYWMLWWFMRAMKTHSVPLLAASMLVASIGFMVKVPYLFFLAIPMLAYAFKVDAIRFLLRNAYWVLAAILIFAAWQWHVTKVNGDMPDWDFIPGYHKFDDMRNWYFGKVEHRFDMELWRVLFDRLKFELLAVTGLPLTIVGLVLGWKQFQANWMRLWLLGAIAYLLIFFTLNVIHDYYQMPFLAPLSFFVAWPLYWLGGQLHPYLTKFAGYLSILALCVVLAQGARLTEKIALSDAESKHFGNFYSVNKLIRDAGKLIEANTPDDAYVITTFGGLDPRCPNFLFAARRFGWSIPKQSISLTVLQRLQAEGASHFALLQKDPLPPDLHGYLESYPRQELIVPDTDWPLFIWKIKP